MTYTSDVNTSVIHQWIADKLDVQKVQENLSALGMDEDTIAMHVKEFRKVKNAKRQFTGFVCLAVGAFMGFVSCVLSIINPIPELYNLILYGLTSLSLTILFLGLYYVLE